MADCEYETYRAHRELWKEIFGDTDQYIDFYFKYKAVKSRVYSKYDGKILVSMVFFTPYEVIYHGIECVCPCIVGVATRPEYRHRGYMRELLEQGMSEAAQDGCRLAFLTPADEKIYEPAGFFGVQYRTMLRVTGRQHRWYDAVLFADMTQEEREQVAVFAADILCEMPFQLYRKRDEAYYEMLDQEMQALDGAVIVLRDRDTICGVAAYLYEDKMYEVTEVICRTENGQRVLESICACLTDEWWQAGSQDTIRFSDGEFLAQAAGTGIVREKETMPYIMVRQLGHFERGLRAYINDIT